MTSSNSDYSNIPSFSADRIDYSTGASSSSSSTAREATATEAKISQIAAEISLTPGKNIESKVAIPANEQSPSSPLQTGLDPESALKSVHKQQNETDSSESGNIDPQISDTDSTASVSDVENANPEITTTEDPKEAQATPKTESDIAVEKTWMNDGLQYLPDDPKEIQKMVKGRRTEIKATKDEFIRKSNKAEDLNHKITKTKGFIKKLENRMQSRKANRGRKKGSIRQTTHIQITIAKERLEKLENEYENYKSHLPNEKITSPVKKLMAEGGLVEPVKGGKGGVYFLCDSSGQRKYVIKPFDEDMLTLNNPKGFALPFCHDDGFGCPKEGVPVYTGAENEALAGKVAEKLGIARVTVKSEMMVLTSDTFHDLTDRVDIDPKSGKEELFRSYGEPDRQKLCIVQEFIHGHTEAGELLLAGANTDQKTFMMMDENERSDLERSILPKDINQEMFEEAGILALACGEVDGNAGNYLISDTPDPQTGLRSIVKIDNAASFTDTNTGVSTGTDWILNCYEKPLSDHARTLIKNLDKEKISQLMKARGFRNEAVEAMKERINNMQEMEIYLQNETSFEDYILYVQAQF